ncbi:MAG: erythronate-4-phosphate dehydrogenase [Ignavibacteriae bacterium]|nr:MAG: erythronate-4-phosphate dehydrogenase [Ignavibacteriota bacterium]
MGKTIFNLPYIYDYSLHLIVKFVQMLLKREMNIIVDENIVYAKEVFAEFGDVQLVDGRMITNQHLNNIDVLIVRSITNVNSNLLNGTKVKFVGTATIGSDHIGLNYLKKNNIAFADAKGCNADSVAEYVFTAMFKIAVDEKTELNKKSIGVVGIGNIGSRVVRIAEAFGMEVFRNDPPLERKGIGKNYVSLDEILQADIITLHVPLNKGGDDKTVHLLNEQNLGQIRGKTIIINTSRGAVIDNNSLSKMIRNKKLPAVLDVWENEPKVNVDLLNITKIGSAHIAGYSLEGKVNGTRMIYEALCNFTGKTPSWKPELQEVENKEVFLDDSKNDELKIYNLLRTAYDIEEDDKEMRNMLKVKREEMGNYFDQLRKGYPIRREFSNYTIKLRKDERHLKKILESLRFKVMEY